MYAWRRMSDEEREESLALRRKKQVPWHSPPHWDLGEGDYHLSAACYEHRPIVGLLPERMVECEFCLLQTVQGTAQEVFAWCILPNHYHLLVRPNDEQMSSHMRRLSISYTKAMNKRYDRVGSLFQGRLKAIVVDRDAYLLHLSRYLHLNPVLTGLVKYPEDWEFSSYREYIGLRQGTLPSPDIGLSPFASAEVYRDFVAQYTDRDQRLIDHLTLE